jgi:hypothetical protein
MAFVWKQIAPATGTSNRCSDILAFMDPRYRDLTTTLGGANASAFNQWLSDATGLPHSLFAYYPDSGAMTDDKIQLVLAITSKQTTSMGTTTHDNIFVEMLGFALDQNDARARRRKIKKWFDLFRQVLVDLSKTGVTGGVVNSTAAADAVVNVRALRSPTMSALLKTELDAHVRSTPLIEVTREAAIGATVFWELSLTRGS